MEDFFGTAIFVIFLAISLFSRMNRAGKQRRGQTEIDDDDGTPRAERPTFPGPVAGPGLPGYPRPEWPQAPTARRPVPKPAPPPAAPAPSEGITPQGFGTEGPEGSLDDVMARFAAESARFQNTRFETELAGSDRLEAEVSPSANDRGKLRLTRAQWARAVALAEILGKPLALRGRK